MRLPKVALFWVFAAAAAPLLAETHSYSEKKYDFATLKTWDFKAQHRISRDPLADNELWAKMLRDEIAADLQKSGYERTADHPDFLVAFYVGLKEKYDVQSMGYGYPAVWGRHRFGWMWGWPLGTDIWQVPYTDSTVIIDVVDAHRNVLIWRGYDTGTIDMKAPDKRLDKGVDNALKEFIKQGERKKP